jgi:hypothetical protein
MVVAAALLVVFCMQGVPAGHQANLDAGRVAFDHFQLADATAAFQRAAAMAPTAADKAVALVWLGAVAAEDGDFNSARLRFQSALLLDRSVAVSMTLSPAIHRLMDEERAKLPGQASRGSATTASPPELTAGRYLDQPLAQRPRWALLGGGAVAAVGVVAVGGGAMVGLTASTRRDAAASEAFQSVAISEYQKARESALWANVLYGAGGVLLATGGGLALASMLGVEQP